MADTNEEKNIFGKIADGINSVVGGIKSTFSKDEEKEKEASASADYQNDTENSVENTVGTEEAETQPEPKEFSTHRDIYILNKGDSEYPEVYSNAQINAMRDAIAYDDARSYGGVVIQRKYDTYSAALETNDYGYASQIAEEKRIAGETDINTDTGLGNIQNIQTVKIFDVDSETLAGVENDVESYNQNHHTNHEAYVGTEGTVTGNFTSGIHKLETQDGNTITAVNQLDIGANKVSAQDRYTSSEIEHMKGIVAEVDAIDGRGTYEDNLEALKDKSYYDYARCDYDTSSRVYEIVDQDSASDPSDDFATYQGEAYTYGQVEKMREEIAFIDSDGDEETYMKNLSALSYGRYAAFGESDEKATDNEENQHNLRGWRYHWSADPTSDKDLSAGETAALDGGISTDESYIFYSESHQGGVEVHNQIDIDSGEEYPGELDIHKETNWAGSPTSFEDMQAKMEENPRSEEEIAHMREIIAKADSIDGMGSYSQNLNALEDGSYTASYTPDGTWCNPFMQKNYPEFQNDSDDDSLYADAESDDDYNKATEYSESAGSETETIDKGEKAKEVLGDITEKALDIEEDLELN